MGWRRDGGASAVEYGALLVVVGAVVAAFTLVALPEQFTVGGCGW